MIFFNNLKLFLIVLFYSLYLNAAHDSPHLNQGILVFLDDMESAASTVMGNELNGPLAAISFDLRLALAQKASPIIASKSLLLNILEAHKTDEFPEAEWCVKQINPHLVMLLHVNYLYNMNTYQSDINVNNNPLHYSKIEKRLGLKVNHLADSSFLQVKADSRGVRTQAEENKFADYFSDSLENIFTPKSTYSPDERITFWSIYMSGHGEAGLRVNGMSIRGFIRALNFFEQEIHTRVLAYMSCFSGGLTQQKVYGQRKLSFPIIAQVIGDFVGHLPYSSTSLEPLPGTIKGPSKRFDNFIQAVTDNNSFRQACEHIIPLIPEAPEEVSKMLLGTNFSILSRWSDIPSIRQTHTDYFQVMADQDCLMAIGGNEPEKSFHEESFATKKPKGLLLYTNEIPFELKLDEPNFEVIISMVPGAAAHRIKKISSLTKTLPEILQIFMRIDSKDASHYNVDKIYLLEEVSDKDDTIIFDITIGIFYSGWEAHFIKDNKHYRLTPTSRNNQPEIIEQWSIKDSRNLILKQSLSPEWSRASLAVGINNTIDSVNHDALEELAALLKNGLAFHSRNHQRIKELIGLVDPNTQIDGCSLLGWIIKHDIGEVNFRHHQAIRLELINSLLERGANTKNETDLVRQAVLNLVDVKIISALIDGGALLDVNEKFTLVHVGEKHALLYWVLNKICFPQGKIKLDYFKERQAETWPLIKFLVEKGAPIGNGDDDVIRHAIWCNFDEYIVSYLVDQSKKISDIFECGPLKYALENGYSLAVIKKLVEKGADVYKVKQLYGCIWWDLYLGSENKEGNQISEFLLSN